MKEAEIMDMRLNDISYHGKNLDIRVSAELRAKVRKIARATMVVSGSAAALMGAYMLTAALMRQGWLLPFAICGTIAVYVYKITKRGKKE